MVPDEFPMVEWTERGTVMGNRALTIHLARPIKVVEDDWTDCSVRVSDVWTFVTEELGFSGDTVQTLVLGKETYDISKGDVAAMLVEEPVGDMWAQWANGLVTLCYRTREVYDV